MDGGWVRERARVCACAGVVRVRITIILLRERASTIAIMSAGACDSVSVACRRAEKREDRREIRDVRREKRGGRRKRRRGKPVFRAINKCRFYIHFVY